MVKNLPRFLLILMLVLTATVNTTNKAAGQATRQAEKVLMGYYAGWTGLEVANIPADKLTHILYAFSDMNAEGKCAVIDDKAAPHMLAFKALKAAYPHLKVLISVGGWLASSHFSANVKTAEQRSTMVQSCIDLWIKGTGLAGPGVIDGIDIDWEFPGTQGNTADYAPEDKANFTLLMREFRDQLDAQGKIDNTTYILSAAVNPAEYVIEAGYDLAALGKILDFLNLMCYDFHGSWETAGPTDFHANLFSDPNYGSASSVKDGVQRFLDAGVPSNKIVVGVPYYGAGWTGVEAKNDGLYQAATGTIDGDTLTYANVSATYLTNSAYKPFRNGAESLWLYSEADKTFITFDDPQTVKVKAEYIVKEELGGAMFWELSQDDASFTLTSTLCTGLGLGGTRKC